MDHFFGALFGLMLNAIPPPMAPPYQPPMQSYAYAPLPSNGDERTHLVTHNGSLMTLTVWPDKSIVIAYAEPKPSLIPYGVRPGTLLIRGQWRDNQTFVGVAHVFYCGKLPYQVTGRVEDGALVMEGLAPRVWPGSCVIADYVWTHNSYLRFERVPDDQHYSQEPK